MILIDMMIDKLSSLIPLNNTLKKFQVFIYNICTHETLQMLKGILRYYHLRGRLV